MKAKEYEVLVRAVEEGVGRAIRRYGDQADDVSFDEVMNQIGAVIEEEVLNTICEWFDFDLTEKIDGTNAQVYIADDGRVVAGSRTRWISPEDDNFGFAHG